MSSAFNKWQKLVLVLGVILKAVTSRGLPAKEVRSWTQFLREYRDEYNFNAVYFLSTNDTAWAAWVRAVYPGVARRGGAFVAVVGGVPKESSGRVLILTPLWTATHAVQLSQYLKSGEEDENIRWMGVATTSFKQLVKRAHFPLLNQVTLVVLESRQISLWEVYQVAPDAPQRTQQVGRWQEGVAGSSGALDGPHEDVASRRTNLTGLHVRCLSLESQPSIFTEKVGNRTVRISGWMADLWEEIRVLSNFTYTCRTPADGEWGAPKSRMGAWSGMVGELDQGTSDVIVAPLDHTQARSNVVDYCMGIQMSGYHLVLRRPDNHQSAWTSFTREFQWQVWLVVGLTLLVSSFVFYATGKSPFEGETISVGDAFLLVFGSLCAQSTSLQLTSGSSRIAFVTIYLNTMLLYAFYTCFIISHLAVTSYSHPFSTLQELYEKRDEYDFGFVKGISVEGSFKLAPDGLYRDVWRDMVEPKYASLVRSDDEGIRRVLAGRYVHLMYGKKFQFKYAHDCDLMVLPTKYMTIATTFAVRKGSPLRRIFTYHLMRLRDTGIFQRHWRRWRPRPSSCDAQKSLQAFTLNNLMTAFLALIALAVLALLTLALERLATRCRGLLRDVDLVATVETNTSWTRLHNQLSRMTLDVFKVQTTFTTTFIRKARKKEGKEEKEEEEEAKRGGRMWNVEEGRKKRQMAALEIEEEGEGTKETKEMEEDVIEEVIEGNEKDEMAELEEAGLRKITTIRLNSDVSDKFKMPDIF